MKIKPIIYQLVVRYFGNTNQTNQRDGTLATNGCGKFDDVSATALQSLHDMGVTHIWLTGCLRQATLTDHSALGMPPDDPDVVKGIAGSFYAVRDYFDVCPDYAADPHQRMAEFQAMVQRVHDAGMKALIDLIPNHVARGYHSVVHPGLDFGVGDDRTQFFLPSNHFFYVTNKPGEPLRLSRPPSWNPPGVVFDGLFPPEDGSPERPVKVTGSNHVETTLGHEPWYETIKLNYGFNFITHTAQYNPRPRTWDLMDQIIGYWQSKGVDGFRCDFAHWVPPEAWQFLVSQAKTRDPDAFFIAEAYPTENSGDPITDRKQLRDAGMVGAYNDKSYDVLKNIYLGRATQDEYHYVLVSPSPEARRGMVQYVENHDERRIGSPITPSAGWTGHSGFGSPDAAYLIAPLQYLWGPGPVLMLNGQEVGEAGADSEGYSGLDGRTTFFDYWCMPGFVKWVNDHKYDGGQLADWQKHLRTFHGGLLAFCQDESVRGDGYWGLKYFNHHEQFGDCPQALYSFARFAQRSGRLLLVIANFDLENVSSGRIRIPMELADASSLPDELHVRLRLTRDGAVDRPMGTSNREYLLREGLEVTIPAQSVLVYSVGPSV